MKNKTNVLQIVSIIVILLFFSFRDVYIKNQVRKSNQHIIAKFVKKEIKPKRVYFYFTYFFKGREIISANAGIKYSITNTKIETELINSLKLNSFYLAKFNSEYPDVIIVNPEKEVTDTAAILKAGFSMEELKRKKNN